MKTLDFETRIAVGDCLQGGSVTVVTAESGKLSHARLVALNSTDGNGWLDIFVAEMELYVEESDILRQPTWNLLHNRGNLVFEREVVLDANLGHI